MRVLFLNQYFPPDPAPTGALFAEIAAEVEKAGHRVDFVAARQEYRGGQKQDLARPPTSTSPLRLLGGRMRREVLALGRMLWDGLRGPKPDVVVSGTSPPCLLVVATLVAGWHRARSAHWAMDLYPELAVALQEVRDSPFSRGLSALMGWCYRRAACVVALDEDMAARLRTHGVEPIIVRPWVTAPVLAQIGAARAEAQGERTWIYSGNLGRAHEWETLLEAQAELERRGAPIRLVFQGGGPLRPPAEARARELGLRQVEWRDYVPEAELPASLLRGHALVVTQLPAAQGLLWPSKLALVVSLPRPIIWVGPADGAVAKMLQRLPHAAVIEPGKGGELADWLQRLPPLAETSSETTIDAAAHRQQSLAEWLRIISPPQTRPAGAKEDAEESTFH